MCDLDGQWSKTENCGGQSLFQDFTISTTADNGGTYNIDVDPDFFGVGSKICLVASPGTDFKRVSFQFNMPYDDVKEEFVRVVVADAERETYFTGLYMDVYYQSGRSRFTRTFGTMQVLHNLTQFELNITYVDATQFQIDLDPMGYSVTSLKAYDIGVEACVRLEVAASDVIVHSLDTNCQ